MLTRYQAELVESAKVALEDAQADEYDIKSYPKHLGRMEVTVQNLIEIIAEITSKSE